MMRRHLLGLRELDAATMSGLLDSAQTFADCAVPAEPVLRGAMVMTLFYEPSTRTEMSFELAARRLGADVVRCDVDRSSVQKGESLLDTALTLDGLGAAAIVIRHASAGAPAMISCHVGCAVINAGDGMHEHPTQGLLDLLTVRQVKGRIAGLRVAIVGDILHSRVARSAVWGFTRLGADVTLIGPPTLLPLGLAADLTDRPPHPHPLPQGERVKITTSLVEGLDGADVVMALRMQLERQAVGLIPSLAEYTRRYAITAKTLALARPDAILMHPGPMNLGVEISADAAYGPRSVIQAQVRNGVFVRMAVLLWALGLDERQARQRTGREVLEPVTFNDPLPVITAIESSRAPEGRGDPLLVSQEIAAGLRPSQ